MKVLLKIHRSPEHRFLVELKRRAHARELNQLIDKGRYIKAIDFVVAKGLFLREVAASEISEVKADLIISETNAYRDLVI
jgi:hypothetical protein